MKLKPKFNHKSKLKTKSFWIAYAGRTGFTLIELMVVVSIITLLASILLSSVSEAKKRARDVTRIEAMRQIAVALDEYEGDNGTYPLGRYAWVVPGFYDDSGLPSTGGSDTFIPGLVSGGYLGGNYFDATQPNGGMDSLWYQNLWANKDQWSSEDNWAINAGGWMGGYCGGNFTNPPYVIAKYILIMQLEALPVPIGLRCPGSNINGPAPSNAVCICQFQ